MLKRILCVDDEPNVLYAFERQFRKEFDIQTASGPEFALQTLAAESPFAVVVSDLRMPVMDGAEFLSRVRREWPDTVRIMLTGQADLNSAIVAVNQGNIFQFLTKPCPGDMLARALNAAVEQHQLITAEHELLEGTLRGSIGVLSEILSLVNPPAFGRANRIRRYVRCMVEAMKPPDGWQFELAAMLSQIGCVTVPSEILEKHYAGLALSDAEKSILSSQAKVGHDLLSRIPRLEMVAQMVAEQTSQDRDNLKLPWLVKTGVELLKIAIEFDKQISRGVSGTTVIARMKGLSSYNPIFVEALQQLQAEELASETSCLSLAQLKTGMILNYDVLSKTGLLLLGKGQEITHSAIARLQSFARAGGIVEPISVLVPHSEYQLKVT
jgi:response regulator RpfG family c-di-GMP phosphodiesterase